MPNSSDLLRYPAEFEHLLLRAATEAVLFTFPTAARTMRFRHRFYAYMKAVRETEQRPDLKPMAKTVGMLLAADSLSLTVGVSCDCWEGELIRSVLGIEKGAEALPAVAAVLPTGTSAEGLAKLQEKLAELRARAGE